MLAAGPFGLGPLELGLIVLVVVLIFGASRLADVGGALGKSIRNFRKEASAKDDEDDAAEDVATTQDEAQPATRHCTNCGTVLDGQTKFCANCGAPAQAGVS